MAELEKIEKAEKENYIKFKTDSIFEFKNLEKNNSVLLKHLEFQMIRQIIVGCFYVLTVVSGSLYGSYRQKSSPSSETSWFNWFDLTHKSNLINQIFVKKGWFWTSLIFIIYAIRVIHANKSFQTKRKSAIRWILATSYWYIITQGFFGPSIVDRIFVFTGGKCVKHQSEFETQVFQVFEAYICKKIGGHWTSGHDISGHCFLLIHASLLLWEEISAFTYRPENWEIAREKDKILTIIFFSFVFLWWLMLSITAIYFHNFPEKLAGTIIGVLYWTLYNFIRYTRPNWFIWLMPYDLEELEKYEL